MAVKLSKKSDSNEFKSILSKAKKAWETSKEVAGAMVDKVPEGEYIMKLAKCQIAKAESSGNLMIKRQHIISEGDLKGAPVYDNLVFTNLDPEKAALGMARVRKWLELLGVDCPNDLEELPALVDEISKTGYAVRARVQHQKDTDFINLRLLELVDGTTSVAATDAASDAGKSDEVDLNAMNHKQLVALIEDNKLGIKIKTSMSDDAVRDEIRKVVKAGESNTEPTEKTEDPNLVKAKEFMSAHDLEYDADVTLEDIVDGLGEMSFDESKLDTEEVAMLKEIGLAKIIKPAEKGEKKITLKLKK